MGLGLGVRVRLGSGLEGLAARLAAAFDDHLARAARLRLHLTLGLDRDPSARLLLELVDHRAGLADHVAHRRVVDEHARLLRDARRRLVRVRGKVRVRVRVRVRGKVRVRVRARVGARVRVFST